MINPLSRRPLSNAGSLVLPASGRAAQQTSSGVASNDLDAASATQSNLASSQETNAVAKKRSAKMARLRAMRIIPGFSSIESKATSAAESASKTGLNVHVEPKVGWRDQVKMVKDAYYNSNFISTDGEPDPCKAEYCYARANTIAAMVSKSGSAEVIGWIEGTIKDDKSIVVSKGVSWSYHISTLVRDNGKVYIADPLINNDILLKSGADVTNWMTSSMGASMAGKVDYVLIPPTDGHFAGMNTAKFPNQTPEAITTELINHTGPVMKNDFVKNPDFTTTLMMMTIYRSAVVDHGLDAHKSKNVVNIDKPKNPLVSRNFLLEKPFSLSIPKENNSQTPALEHTPDVKAVLRTLEIPFSERLEI